MTAASFTPDMVACRLAATSKKQLLQHIGTLAANYAGLCEREVLSAIMDREKLGSTGVGNGLALPHAALHSVSSTITLPATLESPVDFDAPDDVPVDTAALILGSKSDSNGYPATVNAASRLLNRRGDALRATAGESGLRDVLSEGMMTTAA